MRPPWDGEGRFVLSALAIGLTIGIIALIVVLALNAQLPPQ